MKMGRILRPLFCISCTIVGLILSFVVINVGLNWYERIFKDIDYDHLNSYCLDNGLCEHYAVVVDFSYPSGKHRFFVCNLQTKEIIASSLCAHGSGKGSTMTKPVFNNEVGSNCSSLGHYAITGKHKMSSSGLPSFRLKGLDSSNSNAMKRGILIHSAKIVSLSRLGIFPFYLPLDKRISSGCFAVDIDMMDIVGDLVDKEKKPILLFAF